MIKKTVLEKLSGELSEAERESMFRRVKNEIKQTEIDTQTINDEIKDKKVRKKLIRKDMSRSGLWEKFMVWLKSYLTGKTKEDIFASRKLIALKRHIGRRAPGVTGFETRNLTPKLAEGVFDLYKSAIILKESFTNLWISEGNLEKVIFYLLNRRLKNKKLNLFDFMTMDEMVISFTEHGLKERIREEILNRLQEYINTIDDDIFLEGEKQLEPFYFLKEMVLFPYVAFFQLFGFNPAAMPEVKRPFFHNASAMLCLGFLEKLYHGTLYNSMLPDNIEMDLDTINYILKLIEIEQDDPFQDLPDNKGNQNDDEDTPEIIRDEKLKNYLGDLIELHKKVNRFSRNFPVLELLQFFHKDPYFSLSQKVTGLHFRDFYYMILKRSVTLKFEELFFEIKKKSIQNEIDNLFKGKTYFALQNYRMYTSIDYDKMGLPFFRHTRSINLLYNYIKSFYRSYFYDAFQLLDKNILVGNRIVRDKLESSSTSFEEIAQRIMEFDYSLSPESEDGKLFQRLRFSMAGESSHQKMFRTLVLQKDRDVKDLLERGNEDLSSLIKILGDLISSPSQQLQSQLKNHYIIRGKSNMLGSLLRSRREHLMKIHALLTQIIKEERT